MALPVARSDRSRRIRSRTDSVRPARPALTQVPLDRWILLELPRKVKQLTAGESRATPHAAKTGKYKVGNTFVRDTWRAAQARADIFARAVLVLAKVPDFWPSVPSSKFLQTVRRRAEVGPEEALGERHRNLGYFGFIGRYSLEFETFSVMHGPDRDARGLTGKAARDFQGGLAGGIDSGSGASDLARLTHKDADLSRRHAFRYQCPDERRHGSDLVSLIGEGRDDGLGAVEDGDGALALVLHPIHVPDRRRKQPIGDAADLVGGAVIHFERRRSTAHVDPEILPGKRLLEYALAEITGEEDAVRARRRDRGEQPQLGNAEVLRFVDHDMRERFCRARGAVRRHFGGDARRRIAALPSRFARAPANTGHRRSRCFEPSRFFRPSRGTCR